MKKIKGQSTLETALLLLVIVGALFAMQIYLKRSVQGRLRSNMDSIGDQYDPALTNSEYAVNHTSNTVTITNTSPVIRTTTIPCPQGSFGCVPTTVTENVIRTVTTVETIYDNTNRTGNETTPGF